MRGRLLFLGEENKAMSLLKNARVRLVFRLTFAGFVLLIAAPVRAIVFDLKKGPGILALEAGTPGDIDFAGDIMAAAATAGSI